MAKKLVKLSFTDIVLQADSETIRQALEARIQIDELLIKREEAYRQIAQLEEQVEQLVGEDGAFVYPAPPVPVAGFNKPVPASRPVPPKPKPVVEEKPEPETKEEAEKEAKPEEPAKDEKPAEPVEEAKEEAPAEEEVAEEKAEPEKKKPAPKKKK